MKRFSRLKTGFLALILFSNSLTVWGQDVGRDAYGGPFRVKIELAPDVSGVKSRNVPFAEMLNLPVERVNDSLFRRDQGEKEDTLVNGRIGKPLPAGEELQLRRFRLSFSRYVLDPGGKDAPRPDTGGGEAMSKIRSLPSVLGNASARETIEAIGDIFKAQLNLEINF